MRSKNVLKQFKVFSTTNDFKFFSGDSTQHVRLKLDVRLAVTGWSPSQNISFKQCGRIYKNGDRKKLPKVQIEAEFLSLGRLVWDNNNATKVILILKDEVF